jgi:hypothetical protein
MENICQFCKRPKENFKEEFRHRNKPMNILHGKLDIPEMINLDDMYEIIVVRMLSYIKYIRKFYIYIVYIFIYLLICGSTRV